MNKLTVLDLFSGIGGFSLGLERTGGFETVAFCEIEPFPRAVLRKHWPDVPQYEDVRTLTADQLVRDAIGRVDVITGGFPCQDISVAGRKGGMGPDTRSGLWSEIIRLAVELRPQYIIVENVAALLSGPQDRRGGWFGRILGDLAECGYDAEWENIPASALGAPHRRERVWIVAYPKRERLFKHGVASAFGSPRLDLERIFRDGLSCCRKEKESNMGVDKEREMGGARKRIYSLSRMDGVSNGVPNRMDRVKSLGNAVVPQIPEIIGRAILQSRS